MKAGAEFRPAGAPSGAATSLAAVAAGPCATVVRELPIPSVGRDDGLLEVEASGVCGTDWSIYRRDGIGAALGELILGHETVGRIAAIGDRAEVRWGVTVGDRVAVEEYIPCRQCEACARGDFRACPQTDLWAPEPLRYGCTPLSVAPGLWGGFSQVQYLHAHSLVHPVAADLSPEVATLFVPLANGIRWLEQASVPHRGCVVIQGPGQHGLGCLIAAREAGVETIIVSGLSHDARRLAVAKMLGATHVVEADRTSLAEAVADLTDGRLADAVIDVSSGSVETFGQAVAATRRGGSIVLAGIKHGRANVIHGDELVRRELRVAGVRGHDLASVRRALQIIEAGRYPLAELCTHAFGLDAVDRALRTVGERLDPDAIHISVLPGKGHDDG